MTAKRQARSRIMKAMHEGARGMHRLGVITKREMHKYDALRLEPVRDYDA